MELLQPSWNSINKILACFNPVATEQVSAQSDQMFGKRCQKLNFKMGVVVAILDFLLAHLAILYLLGALMLVIVSVQLDYRDVQNMNSQHFSPINIYGPYKCMGKQIWPCRKKIKCQHRTIILAILVDLLSPIICAKIRAQGLFGSGEEDF